MANDSMIKKAPHPIRVWQQSKNYTDEQVAKALKVHWRTVARWCDGSNSPSIEQAQIVSDVTNGEVSLFSWRTNFTESMKKEARAKLKARTSGAKAVGKAPGKTTLKG